VGPRTRGHGRLKRCKTTTSTQRNRFKDGRFSEARRSVLGSFLAAATTRDSIGLQCALFKGMKRAMKYFFLLSQLVSITAIDALARPIKLPPPPPPVVDVVMTVLQAASAIFFQ
jgi:hypothetical protein